MSYEEMLKEFHKKYDHFRASRLTYPPEEVRALRRKLIDEEVNDELFVAMDMLENIYKGNEVEMTELEAFTNLADALADSIYVIVGTAVSYGIPIDEVFAEVHRSNMTKSMLKDEKSIKGKTLKGEGWEPPRIASLLRGKK